MIDKIQIQNFQGHKDTVLELHPNINVIIGKSDQGKTAILRALYWCIFNRPNNNSYVSDWIKDAKENILKGKKTNIILTKNNGEVERFRTKNINGYVLQKKGKTQEFEAIKTEVPKEIQTHINISGINIQKQHDPHFLIGESPGAVARYLNTLVGLDEIDGYLSIIEAKKRKTVKDKKMVSEEIEILQKNLKELEWIVPAQKKLNVLEKVIKRTQEFKLKKQQLIELIAKYKYQKMVLSNILDTQAIEKKLKTIQDIENSIKDISFKFKDLNKSISEYHIHQQMLLNIIDTKSIEKKLKKIDKYKDVIEYYEKKLKTFNTSILRYKKECTRLKNQNKIIEETTKLLPEICPLCGDKLGE